MKNTLIMLPDEVEYELNYEVQDQNMRVEQLAECLHSVGWKIITLTCPQSLYQLVC